MTERAVADTRADVDAVGDAAECARHGAGRAKPHQQPVTIIADLARLAREPGAEQRVDRGDDRKRQCACDDRRHRAHQRLGHRQRRKIHQHAPHRSTCGQRADDWTKSGGKTREQQAVIGDNTDAEAHQKRRHLRAQPARIPHRDESQHRDQNTQRLDLAQMLMNMRETDHAVVARDVAELHEEQQNRRHVLEARHHRMRRKLDQCAEPQQAEQHLEHATQQDDREERKQRRRHVRQCIVGMHQRKEQQTEEERRGDARRIDQRRALAQKHADEAANQRRQQARKRAVGEIFVAKGHKGEHAEADRQRNGERGRNEPSGDVGTKRARIKGEHSGKILDVRRLWRCDGQWACGQCLERMA
jgi:hypothetical protein